MSDRLISVFAVLLSYSRDKVHHALVALTPRSDAKGVHIPLMFLSENRMDIRIRRSGVNSGVSYYYGAGPMAWDYTHSDAGDIYFHDCKASLTDKQRITAREALTKLMKDIMAGETEPKVGTLAPTQEAERLASATSSPTVPEDFAFEA